MVKKLSQFLPKISELEDGDFDDILDVDKMVSKM